VLNIQIEGFKLDGNRPLQQHIPGFRINGILNASLSYTGKIDDFINGKGRAVLEFANGQIQLLRPVLTLERISYKIIYAEMHIERGKIYITRFNLKGRELNGILKGVIELKRNIMKSTLNMEGKIEPFARFFMESSVPDNRLKSFRQILTKHGYISFTIKGSLKDPKVTIL